MRLRDKVAFVTGAGGGIGQAVCQRFLAEGARIAATDIDPTAAEEAIADEYAKRRREALLKELRKDLAAVESYEEQHGSFPELVRVHYEREDGAV